MEEMLREPIQDNLLLMADQLELKGDARLKLMEMVKDNLSRCICGSCPTYQGNPSQEAEETWLYCSPARRQSETIEAREGCNCPGCPVFLEDPMYHQSYYCLIGAAQEKVEQFKQIVSQAKRMEEAA